MSWAAVGCLVALGSLVLINLPGLTRWIRARQLAAHPERAPNEAAALWYVRLTRRLARQGVRKSASQTPREFATKIREPELRTRVERFTSAYEAARFGSSTEDAAKLPELYEEVVSGEKR
jgi:hypothetical protein